MTRQTFLRAALGTGLESRSHAFLQTGSSESARLENDHLIVQVFGNGLFSVHFRDVQGGEWTSDPWQGIACRMTFQQRSAGAPETVAFGRSGSIEIVKQADSIRCHFQAGGATAVTRLAIRGAVLSAAVEEARVPDGASLVSVEYPFRSFFLRTGKDDGYLVLSNGEGCLIPTGAVKLGATRFWSWHDNSHSAASEVSDSAPLLPAYGARRGGEGYSAIVETADDFAFRYIINGDSAHTFIGTGRQSPYPRIACAWPVWLSQKGALGYPRSVRFEFASGVDYNAVAKAYRKEALAKGHLVTLREKARQRPQIDRLAGAPYLAYYAGYPHVAPGRPEFAYRYAELDEAVADLAGPLGLRRAFVHFWGAYSVQPPGCLPFDSRPGPISDLKAAVDRAKKAGFLFTLYNDISAQLEETNLWMPDLMWKSPEGRVAGQRWSRTCSSQFVKLLSREFPKAAAELGLEAAYIDCIDSGEMRECYDPRHPLTRTEERQARTAFYRYVHSLGLIFGGEHAGWWPAAEIEYTNGVGIKSAMGLLDALPVPLYQLVFHDALIPFSHAADDYTVNQAASYEDKVLRDLIRGVPPMFFMNLSDHRRWRKKIRDSYLMTSDLVRAVMYDELLSHEFLSDDQMLQRSRFSSGVDVNVNFDEQGRREMPPKSFRITGLASGVRSGTFSLGWVS
jgi:hypothetical protein